MKLEVRQLGKHWWITGDDEIGPMGPYDSRKEAEEDRRGVARFQKFVVRDGDMEFLTSDGKPMEET